jgi:hypothetical protein
VRRLRREGSTGDLVLLGEVVAKEATFLPD